MMPLRLFSSLLLFLMAVLGSQVQPKSYHRCIDPKKNVGSSANPCDNNMTGYFRNKYDECQKCTVTNDKTITVVSKCNATHDAEFRCHGASYVRLAPHDEQCEAVCDKCRICGVGQDEQLAYEKDGGCQGYTNTICCYAETDIVIEGECVDPFKTTTLPTVATKVVGHTNIYEASVGHASYISPYMGLIVSMILMASFCSCIV